MMRIDQLKSSLVASEVSWRALVLRLIVTFVLLAAVLKIGS